MTLFSTECTLCPRLAAFLREVRRDHPDYFGRPVPPFGDPDAQLLIVGLAPGMHGANATGRPFTGDYAGILLYETLHEFGYASQSTATARDDGLRLQGARITNAVKCVPPENKPTGNEINLCNGYLRTELNTLPRGAVVLALGHIAHTAVLKALDLKARDYPFGHGLIAELPERRRLVSSYHCSRYNTQTRRLTPEMFKEVFLTIRELLTPAVRSTGR